jgi:hypothetical protein
MNIRLVDASQLGDLGIWGVFLTVALALLVGFGTAYFQSDPRASHLLWESLGWLAVVVFALIA